jgi:uncharacterized protein YjgD (DUF1641 family)
MTENLLDMINKNMENKNNANAIKKILDNVNTVADTIDLVKQLQDTGMAENLNGILYFIASLRSVVNDDMLNGISSMLNSLLGVIAKLSNPDIINMLNKTIDGISSGEFTKEPRVHGAFSILSDMKDPEIERGLTVALNILKMLGKTEQ